MSRRSFLLATVISAPLLAVGDAKLLEPSWVRCRRVRLSLGKPTHRLVHFTDVHHKGDRAYLLSVVKRINALSPDLVCFTGDLIEEGPGLVPHTSWAALRQSGHRLVSVARPFQLPPRDYRV